MRTIFTDRDRRLLERWLEEGVETGETRKLFTRIRRSTPAAARGPEAHGQGDKGAEEEEMERKDHRDQTKIDRRKRGQIRHLLSLKQPEKGRKTCILGGGAGEMEYLVYFSRYEEILRWLVISLSFLFFYCFYELFYYFSYFFSF